MLGKVEIIGIDDRNFGEWVEIDMAIDGVRCLPYQITRRTYNNVAKDEATLLDFLYKSGKSMNEKCGTYRNPFSQHAVETEAAS